jgi:WD40 repeat protein
MFEPAKRFTNSVTRTFKLRTVGHQVSLVPTVRTQLCSFLVYCICMVPKTLRIVSVLASSPADGSFLLRSFLYNFEGAYVSSGSSSNGFIFVWNAMNGRLVRMLDGGHQNAGVCGIAWGRGGNCGHQVASADKSGTLIFWS